MRHDIFTTVTVVEGSVDISHAKLPTTRERLVAGQEAVIASDGLERVRQISAAAVTRRLAWRAGKVVFDGRLLREALEEMNRYSARQIRCDDPAICTRRIGGVFAISNPQAFHSTVQTTFDPGIGRQGQSRVTHAAPEDAVITAWK